MVLRLRMIVWAAWRAIVHHDTIEGLMVAQDALDNGNFERLAGRLAHSPAWRRLARTQPHLHTDQLRTAEVLGLPERTLGGALREHMVQNGFLNQPAVPASPFPCDPDVDWAKTRWRECHDVRHTLTGLLPTPADEARLHAFQLGQHRTWFSLLMCLIVPLFAWKGTTPVQTWLRLPDAYRSGRDARLLVDLPVEEQFATPLDEVRARYRVRPLGPGPRALAPRGPLSLQRAAEPFGADERERTAYLLLTTLAAFALSAAVLLSSAGAALDVLALLGLVGSSVRLTAFAVDVQHGALFRTSRVAARAVEVLDRISGGALAHPEVRQFAPRIPFYRRSEASVALPELASLAPAMEAGRYAPPCPTATSSNSSAS